MKGMMLNACHRKRIIMLRTLMVIMLKVLRNIAILKLQELRKFMKGIIKECQDCKVVTT
jgi:hypothetical protein